MGAGQEGRRAIVIGAGLGGIGAAASLAAAGWQVRVFEKNRHVGGKLNVLTQEGFSFDLGPSILTLPHIFEQLFARGGRRLADYVSLQALRPHWRNRFEDGTELDLYPTAAETRAANPTLTARDEQDLQAFLDYSRALYEACRPSYLEAGLDTLGEMVRHHGIWSSVWDFDLFRTVDGGVARRVHNPYLRDILNFFVKYVGSSPYAAPAVLNLMVHVQAEYDLWYVDGGLGRLAAGLARLLADLGVAVTCGAEVAALLHEGGTACGVRLDDGTEARADVVISNMEVVPFYRHLAGVPERELVAFDRFAPACSGLVLHLGLDREYPDLAHHNFFYSANPREHFASVFARGELPTDPTLYVVAPKRTDPTQAPAGCENLKVLPHIPPVQEPPFAAADYDALRERVLDKLERLGLADLRAHIVVEQKWVPEDIEALYRSHRGAIYGVVSDRWRNQGFKIPKQSDRFRQLWFVGGSVNPGGGMPMALLSGQHVADRILAAGT